MREILIADDHFTVRLGVEMVVRELIGRNTRIDFASNGKEMLQKIGEKRYDLLISDLSMPHESGPALITKALAIQSDLRIIILTVYNEENFIKHCLMAGAYAYVNKASYEEELKEAILASFYNKKYISEHQKDQLLRSVLDGKEVSNPFGLLSGREREIALLLLKGHGVLEIANTLAINPSTASTFKGRIFRKLSVHSIIELNKAALRFGFIDDEYSSY